MYLVDPVYLPSKRDFLFIGMRAKDVSAIATKYSLPKVLLSVRDANYVAYVYNDETIYCRFDTKGGEVTKMYRILPHGFGKGDDEWIAIKKASKLSRKSSFLFLLLSRVRRAVI